MLSTPWQRSLLKHSTLYLTPEKSKSVCRKWQPVKLENVIVLLFTGWYSCFEVFLWHSRC